MITSSISELPERSFLPIVSHHWHSEWFESSPNEFMSIRVHSTQVQGKYSVVESYAMPGSSTPLHKHAHDEIFQVLAGSPTFMLGPEIIETQRGTVIFVPAGTPHCWRNNTEEKVQMIATYFPGGIEDLLIQIVGRAPEEIVALASKYGTTILEPPMAS
jgi:quercetin dioxygenase-like cupin family protein